MKPIKVMWNGKHLRDIYPHATKWQVFKFKLKRFIRKCLILTGATAIIFVAFVLGGMFDKSVIYEKVEAIKEVEKVPPVLDRIIKCESGNHHFDSNGQVLMRSNTNKTVDVGVAQINTVWFKKASELGYDLTDEQENRAMALWIIKNKGTSPYSATYNCWK